jgi:hypothetical protein
MEHSLSTPNTIINKDIFFFFWTSPIFLIFKRNTKFRKPAVLLSSGEMERAQSG